MARPRLKMRLGDLLVHENVITEAQLEQALNEQKSSGRKLGYVLTDLNFVTDDRLLQFLAHQLNVPLVDVTERRLDPNVARLLPEVQARRHRALVIEADDNTALIGMSDPADLTAIDAISAILAPRNVNLAVVKEEQLLESFDNLYRRTQEIEQFAQQLQEESGEVEEFDLGALSDSSDEGDVTVARLLQSIFADAVQIRASDIHLEPDEHGLRIRQRVDGQLQENILDEKNIAGALVLKLKLMAGLDISEKRLPQDGRFQMQVKNHRIDVRLSTMPVQYGEACVMRLLDQSSGLLKLEETGMPADIIKKVRYHLSRPYGMILVTGPTGSGKTTTLYAALSELNQPAKKIITVEDPVEYRLPRISQVQVNSKIGLSFGRVLRTTLRQDPDIIMVGEMRDQETVEIGLRGSITGHLVLSTLHTNDAVTSAMRLIDMGAAPYLVASALRAVLAQRLLRRVCPHCVQDYEPDAHEQALMRASVKRIPENPQWKKGKGCQRCNYTGYRGRVGVFELLEIDDPMVQALRQSDTYAFSEAVKANESFKSLVDTALEFAAQGITTLEEVMTLIAGLPYLDESEMAAAEALLEQQLENNNGEHDA
ncbi:MULTISPECIES: GspE/PulE family protein [Gammaproteobacteria]|uniref:GspE/PulE family protein n=1 Tax=Gammaproteobacteria TaxID=1236 RepID=UPI000DD074EB|nr:MULTISPECIES: GspE/PulE family protein [Gammaproteobacteria]RTE86389.1 type II/IV secretion system protein [Aliidiomarina sp. B3213]TCZ91736.1 type II/IV secretion system protein [Lysobacter sp. N42]